MEKPRKAIKSRKTLCMIVACLGLSSLPVMMGCEFEKNKQQRHRVYETINPADKDIKYDATDEEGIMPYVPIGEIKF